MAIASARKIQENRLQSALLDLILYEPVLEGGEGSKAREGLKEIGTVGRIKKKRGRKDDRNLEEEKKGKRRQTNEHC